MKKFFLSLALLLAFTSIGLGQGSGPITVKEVDGSPVCNNCRTFVFPNGSLTVSGNKVTVASGGGGGGSPGGSNTQVQYNAAGSFGGVAGFTFNGTSTINLGVAGTSVGAIGFRNATSGTITLQPVTGALGTVTLSLPAVTDTLVGLAATQTLTNKTLTAPVIATISNTGTLTLPTSTDTLVGKATTDTFTNKTLTASSNVLGGVTMTLGSDADGDMYYRASNVLTRLPKGTAGQVLTMNAGATAPEWAAGGGGGGITIGTTTITSGTNTRVLFNNSGVVGEYTVTGTGNAVLSASPTLTGRISAADGLFATSVTTGTGATAGLQVTANSLTTGNGVEISSTSATSGNLVSIASTSTAAASSTLTGLRVAMSGANGTTAQTVTGATISVTNTNATSGTNIGLTLTASGATTANRAINVTAGQSIVADGTLAAPGIGFSGSTNSGFYQGSGIINVGLSGVAWGRFHAASGGGIDIYGDGGTSPMIRFGGSLITTLAQAGTNGVLRAQNSFIIAPSASGSIGTSGTGVLALFNGVAPSSSPADEFQLYSADSAAGDANAFARNEAGEVNRLTGLSARVSTQFDKTSDTTLANVTGLTRNVEAGRTYAFTATLYTTSNVAGGVKAAIGGTATATSIIYQAEVLDGSTLATMGTARATSLATTVGDVTAVTAARITITGTIAVEKAGTLTVQFAQNASNGSASSVLVNSSFQLIPIS